MSDIFDAVAPFGARFNLCHYFLDHNLEEGRGDKVALRLPHHRRRGAGGKREFSKADDINTWARLSLSWTPFWPDDEGLEGTPPVEVFDPAAAQLTPRQGEKGRAKGAGSAPSKGAGSA